MRVPLEAPSEIPASRRVDCVGCVCLTWVEAWPNSEPACGRADWEDNGVLNEVEIRELTARLSGPQ
jgi:hypothetical protein